MTQPAPGTHSRALYDELRHAMGVQGKPQGHPEEHRVFVADQTAAAWFANNRAADSRRICVIRRGPDPRRIGFVYDCDPQGQRQGVPSPFMEPVPVFDDLNGVARFVLLYLFGN